MGLAKDRSRSSYASRPHVRSYAALFLVFAVIAMMVTIFENIDITGFAVNYQSLGVNQTMVQQGGSLRFTATGSSTLGHDVKLVCRLVSDNTLLCSSSRVESNPSCNVGIPADFQTGTHEVKCELREIDADGAITDRKEKRINVTVTSPGGGGGGQCATQPNGIVSWWRAEGNASDAKGINHGTLVGTTFATGKVGQTFSFDGNDYVRVSHSSSLEPQELTVMAWLYPQPPHAGGAGGFGGIVEKATEDRDSYALTAYDNGVIAFSINWEQGFERCDSAAGALPGNAWSYVAATFDTARSAKIYVNGALSKSCTFTSGIKPITGNLHIGLNPGGADEYFKGRIDELAIFNKALSSSDISAVFNAGPDGMCVAAPPPGGPVMSSLTPNPATVTQGSTVTFNSVGSSPGGNVKLVCGSTSRGTNICPESSSSFVASNPSCTYSVPAAQSPGNYSIYCRIKDTTGAESPERTTQITVQAAGGAPVLNSLGANPQTIAPGDSVTFTGSGTWTNNVKLICRQGANQVCQTASFVPASPSCSYTTPSEISAGNYTIFCKLRDTTGAESSERSTQVTVQSGGGAQCGNGVREGSEQCDDGNANSNDACTNSCRNNVCGDGFVATGAEQCDDGNLQGGDGCSSTCTTEQQPPALTSIGVPPQVRQGETLTITSVASSPAGQNIQLRCGKASGTSDLCPGGAYASQNPACSVTVAANYQLGTLPVFCKVYDDAGTPSGEKSATTEVVAGGPALTGLTANPPLVQIGRTITFQGTGQSPSRTVKLACGSSQGANDICTSASFASADPSCPFTVPSNYPKGDRVVYCRVLDSANAVSTDRTVTMTVTDPTICTPLPPPTCNPGETPEAIDTNNDGCHDSYRCIPPVTSACRTITADTALTGNMVADRSPCLILDASAGSIALDGASYTITGDGSGIAIETRGSGGVGIKNLLLSNFQEGIVSTAGAGDLIINNSEISAVGSTAGTAPRAAVRVESANSLSLTRTTIS
ncbi:MAG: DUF4215 domain-containing protein, partial [Candidatus Aenigmarchaeota archaeon]|nr:DUF4215 domain-containing protein [Candidatus Aenigmarchaeota archaeon]